jgi:hypothetical protein
MVTIIFKFVLYKDKACKEAESIYREIAENRGHRGHPLETLVGQGFNPATIIFNRGRIMATPGPSPQ